MAQLRAHGSLLLARSLPRGRVGENPGNEFVHYKGVVRYMSL